MRAEDHIAEGPTLLSGSGGELAGDDERLPTGTRAGDYELERFLGAGAMGDVYAGRQPLIGKRVAVKVIKRRLAGSADAVERFLREARAVNQVGHANVVDIFAVGRLDDGRLYLVMDLLEGESLGARLRKGPMDPDQTLEILDAVAAALDAAHGRGVIHRDLKPDNVFLAARGDGPSVYVLDFGIAKLLTATEGGVAPGTLTDRGTWMGTPAYMSPEQWGSDGATGASDRYALGVMAFEMLAGRAPFQASSLPGMMEQHFRAAVPTLSSGAGKVLPAAVDQVLARAMAKDPEHRYTTARELVGALRGALGTAIGRAVGARSPAPRSSSRRSLLVAMLGGATAVAATVTAVVVLRGGGSRAAARPAADPAIRRDGALEITSSPSGARVRVDGIDRGATPLTLPLPLAAGEVAVVIDKPGYALVTRTVRGDRADSLRVPLSPVTGFAGVWALPDGVLRGFERRGEQVAMFTMESAGSERQFERFFEFVAADAGLISFVAAETHTDARAPDEPSCNVKLRAEYQYDVTLDALARRQERVQLEFEDGRCALVAKEWGEEVGLRRMGHADGGAWAESSAGSGPIDVQVNAPDDKPQGPPDKESQQKKAPPKQKEKQKKGGGGKAGLDGKDDPFAAGAASDADKLQGRDLDQRDQDQQQAAPLPEPKQQANPAANDDAANENNLQKKTQNQKRSRPQEDSGAQYLPPPDETNQAAD